MLRIKLKNPLSEGDRDKNLQMAVDKIPKEMIKMQEIKANSLIRINKATINRRADRIHNCRPKVGNKISPNLNQDRDRNPHNKQRRCQIL